MFFDELNSELSIPDFVSIEEKLDCNNCYNRSSCRKHYIGSRYDCRKFIKKLSIVKLLLEIILFSTVTVLSLIFFSNIWTTILRILFTFTFLLTSDILSDKLIEFLCLRSERIRREKYDLKVQKLKKENEDIKRAKAGITEEVQKFLDFSVYLFSELDSTFISIKDKINMEEKEGERVIVKFQATLKELEILNSKLSENTFESSYISTLYEIHLPKLLEYSKKFLSFLNSDILTQKQTIEFAKLLEVFRVKISNHTEYLENKIEDDFIVKMKALNQDVIPNFDGSEDNKDE